MTTRRDLFRLALGAAAAAAVFDRTTWTAAAQAPAAPPAGPFTLAPLPYAADALEPHIDAQTMTIHHGRHHQAYVNNLNAALEDHPDLQKLSLGDLVARLDTLPASIRTAVRNNGGGHMNHDIFWTTMKKGGGGAPAGDLAAGITSAFGGHDKWREAMTRTAMGVFGSGWAWLAWDPAGKRLVVEPCANQDTPAMQGKVPLVGVDVWEHAYYLKYQNRRRDYVDAWFNVIDWDAVAARYAQARKA
ncbi:MAG: superoxide dismutase [Vicinamibacterales bacterium]|nr:superoxide dismutase [Vicinamibacterales bacterium]